MPLIALGTNIFKDEQSILDCLKAFYETGGRKIDTASCTLYYSESQLGFGFKTLGLDRKSLFLNSKIWIDDMGYDSTLKSVEKSLKDMHTDYLDLCHIHWPGMDSKARIGTYRALEDLYAQGTIKAIGLSNFYEEHLKQILDNGKIVPHVNQIEIHPGCFRKSTINFCKEQGIVLEASSPLAQNNEKVMNHPAVVEVAQRKGKNNGQVILRWLTQNEIVPTCLSRNPSRITQNFGASLFDWELTPEEMDLINNNTSDNKIVANFSDRLGGMQYDENTSVEGPDRK